MTERSIFVRLSVRDADVATRAIAKFGGDGRSALQAIERASTPASRGLLAVNAAANSLGGGVRSLAANVGPLGAALSAVGPAGLAAAAGIGAAYVGWRRFDQAVTTADGLSKLTTRLGFNVEAFQEYRFAAARSGIATAEFEKGIENFTRRLADARRGQGELAKVTDEYGIALSDSAGKQRAAEDVLRDIGEAMGSTTDEADRLLIAYNAFGRSGLSFANLFKDGASAVDDLRARARELGVVLDEDMVHGAQATRDALDEVGEIIDTKVNASLLRMAPLVTQAISGFFDLQRAAADFAANENERARIIYNAANGIRPTPNNLGDSALDTRAAALREELADAQQALAEFDKTGDGRLAAAGDRFAAALRAKLTATVDEVRTALDEIEAEVAKRGTVKLTVDVSPSGVDLDQVRKGLGDLFDKIDPLVKLQKERADALAKVNEAHEVGAVTDEKHAEMLDRVNELYRDRIEKLDGTAERRERDRKAAEDQAAAERELAKELEQLGQRVDRIIDKNDAAGAATRAYREQVDTLNEALRRGVLDEQEHSLQVDRATEAYNKARSAALGYGGAVQQANRAAATAAPPAGLDFRSLLNTGVAAASGQGFDIISFGTSIGRTIGSTLLDSVSSGTSFFDALSSPIASIGRNVLTGLSNVSSSLASGLAQIAPGVGNAIASAIGAAQGLGPAGLITGGLGPGGAGGAVASQVGSGALAAAGFSAALPAIGIAIAGLALIASKVFGPGKSSGPALGARFGASDGEIQVADVSTDNGGDIEGAQKLADGVQEFVSQVVDALGGRLRDGAFNGVLGFANGGFGSAIGTYDITPAGVRDNPDMVRRFGSGDDAASQATADFIARGLQDALSRDLVEGITDSTAAIVQGVLGRLDATGGFGKLEDLGEALDFATTFEDSVKEMSIAGDAAAQQLHAIAGSAKDFGKATADSVKEFRDNALKFFGPTTITTGAIDQNGRVDASRADTFTDDDGNQGFVINGERYVFRPERGGDNGDGFGFVNQSTGAVIIERTIERALERLASMGVRSDASEGTATLDGSPGDLAAAQSALGTYVDTLLGLNDLDTKPLQGFALELENGKQRIESLREALLALGLTAAEADTKIAEANTALADRVREDFDRAIADQITTLRSPSAAGIVAIAKERDDLLAQAASVGGDVSQIMALFEERARALAEQDLREAEQAELDSINRSVAARDAEISVIEGNTSALEGLLRAVQRTRLGLRTNDATTILSPTDQLATAEAAFNAALSKALAGDQEAAAEALRLGEETARLGRAVWATGPQYVALFNRIDAGLGQLEGNVDTELSIARSQLDELRGIRSDLQAQMDALSPAQTNNPDRNYGANPVRNRLIADLFPEFTGNFSGGAFNAFRPSINPNDSRLAALAALEGIAFADGGDHMGGLRLVGERGPELEATGRSRIYSNADTTKMLRAALSGSEEVSSGLAPAMAPVVTEIRGMRGDLRGFMAELMGLMAGRPTARYGFT